MTVKATFPPHLAAGQIVTTVIIVLQVQSEQIEYSRIFQAILGSDNRGC
jgi:hypothetical protein